MAWVPARGGHVWSVHADWQVSELQNYLETLSQDRRVFLAVAAALQGVWSVRACVGARAGCRATAVAAMSILGIRGPSTSSCDVSASADLTGTRGYAVQGSRGRAGGRNEPSSAAERARSAGTATSRLRYSALIWRMCGRLAAHEVCYEPKPPGVHEPGPIRESGGLRGHQMDDDCMTAHSHMVA